MTQRKRKQRRNAHYPNICYIREHTIEFDKTKVIPKIPNCQSRAVRELIELRKLPYTEHRNIRNFKLPIIYLQAKETRQVPCTKSTGKDKSVTEQSSASSMTPTRARSETQSLILPEYNFSKHCCTQGMWIVSLIKRCINCAR